MAIEKINISFLGDISLNDNYVQLYKEGINPFLSLEPILKESDYVVGNLECMAKGEDGENVLKKPRLTTTVETLNYLKNINLSVACLAQNHVYDHLENGFLKTTNFLNENHIQYLGASFEKNKVDAPKVIEKDGIKVGILNYVTIDTNTNLPDNAKIFLNIFALDKVIKDIKNIKPKVNHVVIMLHWGGRVEGGLFPDWDQPKLARELIDAGADLIIGHHSHTIQPYELYKGKYIFYSLGNFCFSDFWFEGKFYPMPKRRMVTNIVQVFFSKTNYEVSQKFFKNGIQKYTVDNKQFSQLIFKNWIFKNILIFKLFWGLYFFSKTYFLPAFFFIGRKDIKQIEKLKRIIKYIIKKTRAIKKKYYYNEFYKNY